MFTFWKLYVLELLRCVQLRFVTLGHVTSTLCCFTLCINILAGATKLWILHCSMYVQFTVNAFVLNNEPHAPQSLHCYPSHCSCLLISPSYRIKILEATQAIVHTVPGSDRRLSRLSWRESRRAMICTVMEAWKDAMYPAALPIGNLWVDHYFLYSIK